MREEEAWKEETRSSEQFWHKTSPVKHENTRPDSIFATENFFGKTRSKNQAASDTGACRCTSTRGAGWSPARPRGVAGTRPWRRSS